MLSVQWVVNANLHQADRHTAAQSIESEYGSH